MASNTYLGENYFGLAVDDKQYDELPQGSYTIFLFLFFVLFFITNFVKCERSYSYRVCKEVPKTTILVDIDGDYIDQEHISCLLDPNAWIHDVVSFFSNISAIHMQFMLSHKCYCKIGFECIHRMSKIKNEYT